MDESRFVYRSSFPRTFLVIFTCLFVVEVAGGVALLKQTRGFHLDRHTVTVCLLRPATRSCLGALVVGFVLTAYFTITVTEKGIHSYNAWGKYRFVTWKEMTGTKPFSLPALKYIRIFTVDGKSPLYIPLFLNLMADFKGVVDRLAPDDNPLKAYFAAAK